MYLLCVNMYIIVVCEKIRKQITIEILININLSYTNYGYRVATIVRGFY